jgi:glycosyltransferase involved in cell wall biosynthesis
MVPDIKLSILICTLPLRLEFLQRLEKILKPQLNEHVQVLINADTDMEIGKKRNKLISQAEGEYACFIDDDDLVTKDYVSKILQAVEHVLIALGFKELCLPKRAAREGFSTRLKLTGGIRTAANITGRRTTSTRQKSA